MCVWLSVSLFSSISISLHISYLSIHLSNDPPQPSSVSGCLFSVNIFICSSISILSCLFYIKLFIYLSDYSFYLSISLFIYLCIYYLPPLPKSLSLHLSISLSVCRFIYLSISPSSYLSISHFSLVLCLSYPAGLKVAPLATGQGACAAPCAFISSSPQHPALARKRR